MRDYKFEKVLKEVNNRLPDDKKISKKDIDDLFQISKKLNKDKESIEINSELEKLINLFIGEWTLRSVGTVSHSPSTLQYIITGFFVQISNTLSCILVLVKDGFDYQAANLFRNLIDISYTLLTLIIDDESRDKFLEAARNSDEKTIWYMYFRFEKMEKVIWKYISSIGDEKEVIFLENKGSEIYHWLSSFVHNDFINILLYSYSEPENEDGSMIMNLHGNRATRVSKILRQVADIMFLVDMLFVATIYDKQIKISKEHLCTESEAQEYWNRAIVIYLIANEYCLAIKRGESNSQEQGKLADE